MAVSVSFQFELHFFVFVMWRFAHVYPQLSISILKTEPQHLSSKVNKLTLQERRCRGLVCFFFLFVFFWSCAPLT